MATKTKAKVKAKTKRELRPGSKQEILYRLLMRKSGTTQAEASKALGWKSVNFWLQASNLGLKLRKEKKEGVDTRYFGN